MLDKKRQEKQKRKPKIEAGKAFYLIKGRAERVKGETHGQKNKVRTKK